MTADKYISKTVQPLKLTDTGLFALDMMNDFHVRHLPVVKDSVLLGLITEQDILEFNLDDTLESYQIPFSRPSVSPNNHLYEILRLMADFKLTVVPVTDAEDKYIGAIAQEDLILELGNMGSFTVPGSIIVLEMHRRDYSLARISSIIEQENVQVISTFITSDLQSDQAEVTLKVNSKDIRHILASLERFGYAVKASFHESEFIDDVLKDRYEALMMYLNV